MPEILKEKLAQQPHLQKILSNMGWLFIDRILRMGIGLLVIIWMARYLGPQQFGLFNYAISFVALFSIIGSLGLNSIVVRDLVNHPDHTSTTLGTAFTLQLISSLLAFSIAIVAIAYVRPNDLTIQVLVGILGFVMVFKATDTVKYWFESQVRSKYTVIVENAAFIIFAGIKVALILAHATIMAFAWATLAEAALIAVALLVIYSRHGKHLSSWQVRMERAKSLLQDSWPLIFSGLAIAAYMRIDQIMLGELVSDEAVGVFSAAVRISEVWYFIPVAIVASVFPSIIEAKKHSETVYYQRLQKLYDLMVILALSVAIPMTFLSNWLAVTLFGETYQEAGAILSIHIWASVFVFLGVASSKWFLIENMQKNAFYRTLLGMLINITANYFLIPSHGAIGAAISTLLSQIIAAYLFDALTTATRRSFWLKTASLIPLNFIRKKASDFNNY